MSTYQAQIAKAMSETELKNAIIEAAHLIGWLVHHDRPARYPNKEQYATHVQGNAGFPDLCMLHPGTGKLALFELKSETGPLRKEQKRWLEGLARADSGRVRTGVWRPSDWLDGTVGETLLWGTQ